MNKLLLRSAAAVCAVMSLGAVAQAQSTTGIYGVARGGIQVDSKAKYRNVDGSAFSTIDDTFKNKLGFTGEIGGGYDFGRFRLEQTIGYASTKLDRGDAGEGGLISDGRSKAFTVALAGYVDFPVTEKIVPFVGGGAGISRVDARLVRTDANGVGSRFDDKDYGLRWHADAGVGYRIMPTTTIEVSGRYSQTSMLKFKGESGNLSAPADDTFKPRLSNISAQVGVRHIF